MCLGPGGEDVGRFEPVPGLCEGYQSRGLVVFQGGKVYFDLAGLGGDQEVDLRIAPHLADPLDNITAQPGVLDGAAAEPGLVDVHVAPEPADKSVFQEFEDGVDYPDQG